MDYVQLHINSYLLIDSQVSHGDQIRNVGTSLFFVTPSILYRKASKSGLQRMVFIKSP